MEKVISIGRVQFAQLYMQAKTSTNRNLKVYVRKMEEIANKSPFAENYMIDIEDINNALADSNICQEVKDELKSLKPKDEFLSVRDLDEKSINLLFIGRNYAPENKEGKVIMFDNEKVELVTEQMSRAGINYTAVSFKIK